MEVRIVYTPHVKAEEVIKELEMKINKTNFEPTTILTFFTDTIYNFKNIILEYLESKFPECHMAGCFIEGYVTKDAMWNRGLVLLLIDGKVDVQYVKGENTENTFSKLNRETRENDKKLLMFPVIYLPGKFGIVKMLAKDKWYYRKYKKAESREDKIKVLKDYSEILESNMIYPINKALRFINGKCVCMCLMPLEGKFNTPTMFKDYKEVSRSVVSISFKKAILHYRDVFPERGKSFDETYEILSNYFTLTEIVESCMGGISIGEINGLKVVDFLKAKTRTRDLKEDEMSKKLEKGNLEMVSPYGLAFISTKTFGCSMIGLNPFPLNIYPSIFDLDVFSNKCVYLNEHFKDGNKIFRRILRNYKFEDSFKLIVLDYNIIPIFGRKLKSVRKFISDSVTGEFLCVFSSNPSAKGVEDENYLTKIEEDVFTNGTGTSFILELQ